MASPNAFDGHFHQMPGYRGSGHFAGVPIERPGSDIKKTGYLKKLKTMKKKFFVLRSTSSSGPARLEYYDNEKKFKSNLLPKRSIELHTCFNINKKSDTKHKYAIAIFTKDECFSVMLENEKEQDDWLELLLKYHNEYLPEDEPLKQHYEFVWQGKIQPEGLGQINNINGVYRLCLDETAIHLVKINNEKPAYTFQTGTIKTYGRSDNRFFINVGRSAPTGAGELWIQMEDSLTAQNLHEIFKEYMKRNPSISFETGAFRARCGTLPHSKKDMSSSLESDLFPRPRTRTSSASLAHSPRKSRMTHSCIEARPQSTVYVNLPTSDSIPFSTSPISNFYDRADSLTSKVSRSSISTDGFDSSPGESSYLSQSLSMSPDCAAHQLDEDFLDFHHPPQYVAYSSGNSSPGEKQVNLETISQDGSYHSAGYMDMNFGSSSRENVGDNVDPYIDMSQGSHRVSMDSASQDGNVHNVGYMDMNFKSNSRENVDGIVDPYIDMTQGHQKVTSVSGDPYMLMGSGKQAPSVPISTEHSYMDMSTSTSHAGMSNTLPTVKEGGSAEGYVSPSPNEQPPPPSSMHGPIVKPAKAFFLLDDSIPTEFPKRAYSVGSRPVTKSTCKLQTQPAHTIKQSSMDGRSSSAPHLVPQKPRRSTQFESYTTASECLLGKSFKTDDSDEFMEIDFYRPRTASDSFGAHRPRSSSMGKTFQNPHRPRSSSHGQGTRPKIGAFESVRTTSQELFAKAQEFRRGSPDISSSSESIKKLSEELRNKTSQINADYIDMSKDVKKSKPAVISQSSKSDNSGYVDMTSGHHILAKKEIAKSVRSHSRSPKTSISESHPHSVDNSLNPVEKTKSSDSISPYVVMNAEKKSLPKSNLSESRSKSQTESAYMEFSPGLPSEPKNIAATTEQSPQPSKKSNSNIQNTAGRKSIDSSGYMMFDPKESSSVAKNEQHIDKTDGVVPVSSNESEYVLHDPRPSTLTSTNSKSQSSDETYVVCDPGNISKMAISKSPTPVVSYIVSEESSKKPSAEKKTQKSKTEKESTTKKESQEDAYMTYDPGIVSKKAPSKSPSPVVSYVTAGTENTKVKTAGSDKKQTSDEKMNMREKKSMSKSKQKTPSKQVDRAKKSDQVSVGRTKNRKGSADKSTKVQNVKVDSDEYVSLDPQHSSSLINQVKPSENTPSLSSVDKKKSSIIESTNEPSKNETSQSVYQSETVSAEQPISIQSCDNQRTANNSGQFLKNLKTLNRKELKVSLDSSEKLKKGPEAKSSEKDLVRSSKSKIEKGPVYRSSSKVVKPEVIKEDNVCACSDSGSLPKQGSFSNLSEAEKQVPCPPGLDSCARSRHSFSDAAAYEMMSFTSNSLSKPSSQSRLSVESEKSLNYADLDLDSSTGGSDNNLHSPRVKSRHASAASDQNVEPLQYAQIDFKSSENLAKRLGSTEDKLFL